MAARIDNIPATGFGRAIFPGSFKPPHRGHFETVRALLARSDVDEVVVIIANRSRLLPGTTLAIDAEIARDLWLLYLAGTTRVRVEIAEHTAVEHALTYFDHAGAGDRLLFCVGEADILAGDDRFAKIDRLGLESGVSASTVTTATEVRSTSLRRLLAGGENGRREFFAKLPGHLSERDRQSVWETCRDGVRPVTEIYRNKVARVLRSRDIAIREPDRALYADTVDPEFAITASGGERLIVKYAGDSIGDGAYDGNLIQKPRRRLAAERRVLKHLTGRFAGRYAFPQVVFFDKRTRTLATTDLGDGKGPTDESVDRVLRDPQAAEQIGRFLAELHSMPLPPNPFRGTGQAETDHWESIILEYTDWIDGSAAPPADRKKWREAVQCSLTAAGRYVVHLDFRPENLFFRDGRLGVTRFERSSGYGDPAVDLGTIIGHFHAYGRRNGHANADGDCIRRLLSAYEHTVVGADRARLRRAMAIAAAIEMRVSADSDTGIAQPIACQRHPRDGVPRER